MWLALKRWPAWITRWLGRPHVAQLHFGYENAGLTVWDEPIPWNAESVLLETTAQFPNHRVGVVSDLSLQLPGRAPVPAVALSSDGPLERARFRFRFPPLPQTCEAKLFWRSFLVDRIDLPVLSKEQFLQDLQLRVPTVYARLGPYHLPCQTVVDRQASGWLASGLLASPTCLLPAVDLPCVIEFIDPEANQSIRVPVPLSGQQLIAHQALVSAAPPEDDKVTRWQGDKVTEASGSAPSPSHLATLPPCHHLLREGRKIVQWTVAGRLLARREVRVISTQKFQQSLHLVQAYYSYRDASGSVVYSRYLPTPADAPDVGPYFLIGSREPALAAWCHVQLRSHFKGSAGPPQIEEQVLLLNGGPVPCTTSLGHHVESQHLSSFELLSKGERLGLLPLGPRHVATFTSEGGFLATEELPWTEINEEELADHLHRLMALPQQ
jgi:hypothetical protein